MNEYLFQNLREKKFLINYTLGISEYKAPWDEPENMYTGMVSQTMLNKWLNDVQHAKCIKTNNKKNQLCNIKFQASHGLS